MNQFATHSLSQEWLQITLIRHGRPTVSLKEKVKGRSLRQLIQRYDQAGVAPSSSPPFATLNQVQNCSAVFTSDYPRALDSAKILGASQAKVLIPLREIDCWQDFATDLSLPGWYWIVLTRVLWPAGHLNSPESFAQAQTRAQQAATFLIDHARKYAHIVAIGHGGMNTLIARELRGRGWKGPAQPKLSHWGATSYRLPLQS